MMKVGIHVNGFPIPSEAFVAEQARALRRFDPVIFARRKLSNVTEIQCLPIPQSALDWRRKLFAVWPGAWAWGGPASFKDVALIHAHFGPNGVYAMPIAKKLQVPLVVTFHGFDATVRRKELFLHGGIAGRQYLLGRARLQRNVSRIIAVSQFIERRLLAMGFTSTVVRQHYIGVDHERFSPLLPSARSLDVVCVGRLMAAKGIETLIRAFALIGDKFPDSKLRLIGDGPDRPVFMELARTLQMEDRVIFEGTMAHAAVAAKVRQCAISVLASQTGKDGWQEAFGLASIEAAAAGLPSIVTRHGGLPETVVDGKTGLIVAERSVPELADAMSTLLLNSTLRTQMGEAGRARVLQDFDLFKQTTKLEEIYEEAVTK